MTNALTALSPVMHDIQVNVVSAEEASLGVAEFSADGVVLGAHALAEALAEANRLLAPT
jgi:hypothetical protein